MPRLEEWQEEVFNDIKDALYDFYVIVARRQVGKSVLAVDTLIYFAVSNPNSIGAIVEPTLSQSRRVYKQLIAAIGGEGSPLLKSSNATLLTIEFINGSEIVFKSAEQGVSALAGLTVKRSLLVIDEAAYIPQEIIETLYPVVDACKCPVLMISTPLFCSGEFYNKHLEGKKEGGLVKTYEWKHYDTSKYLSEEKLEYYRQTMSPLKFQSDYLGEFIKEGSYIFGDITPCISGYSKNNPVYGGIDWSVGKDGDYTVLILMDEDKAVTHLFTYKDFTPTDLIKELGEEIKKHPTLKAVMAETNSIGDVYMSFLKKAVKPGLIKGFTTTNDSKRRIIEQLISAFQTKKITIPNEKELIAEIQHYNIEKTPAGRITYNGADGYHDDHVMALAFVYEATKKSGNISISIV